MSINVLPKWHSGKESTCQYRRHERHGFSSLVGKIPWSRKWQHTLVFFPRRFHGQRSLMATVFGVTKNQDMTKQLNTYTLECESTEEPAQFSSVAQSCPTLCDPMNRSTPGLPVHHRLPEFTQTQVHRVRDAIQPSHPLSPPPPPAPSPTL